MMFHVDKEEIETKWSYPKIQSYSIFLAKYHTLMLGGPTKEKKGSKLLDVQGGSAKDAVNRHKYIFR